MQFPLADLVESAFPGCKRRRIPQKYRELCRILCSGQTISCLLLWISEGPSYAMLPGVFPARMGPTASQMVIGRKLSIFTLTCHPEGVNSLARICGYLPPSAC